MEYNQMARQVVDFQRMSFENWYNAVSMIQDQAKSSMDLVLGQTRWMPEDSRQSIQNWIDVMHQERARFKNYVEKGFDDLEKFVAEGSKTAAKTMKKQAANQ
jgi:hypothetical protein